MLDAFSKLKDVDTKGVQPLFQPVTLKNRLREDTPQPSLTVEEASANTTHKKNNFFKGPKTV